MKAVYRSKYGPPEVLSIRETVMPVPAADEVLIKVIASTVNRTDCGILRGKPFILRFFTGLFRPASRVPGTDFAGIVEQIGKNVTLFNNGDSVMGFDDTGLGSHARYFTIREDKTLTIIPGDTPFVQAAASLEGAHYALNFIKRLKLHAGQKALVNGATGAIGSAAVQLLKYYNVYVTAVCPSKAINVLKSMGADKVIAYDREDFTLDSETYDFIFDAVGRSTFSKCRPLLKPKGIYISSEPGPWAQNLFYVLFTAIAGGKKVVFPFPSDIAGTLTFVKDLLDREKFQPLIDRTFPLEKIREAYTYVESGQKMGNVILSFEDVK